MTTRDTQDRAKRLRERHARLMGESNAINVDIGRLMRRRNRLADVARECFDEAERIDPRLERQIAKVSP